MPPQPYLTAVRASIDWGETHALASCTSPATQFVPCKHLNGLHLPNVDGWLMTDHAVYIATTAKSEPPP